jgi:TatD DNase family protein
MVKMIDTHAHIYLKEFQEDLPDVIQQSKQSGVKKIFMPNIDAHSIDHMLSLESQYNDYCIPMMGLHPCYVKEDYKAELKLIESWLGQREFCAVGEIGIDLYWDKSFMKEQIKAFETQIEWAKELNIPIVIHCRESIDMTIDVVKKHQDGDLHGIFHCFSGNINHANSIIDLNFILGIGGVVTFKNGGLDKVVPYVDLKHIVLETDSPYLAPTPYRGKRNSPAYLKHIAEKIAELKGCTFEEVALETTDSANNIFSHG